LVQAGDDVLVLDNISTGNLKNISHLKSKIQIHQGDIRDTGLVNELTQNVDLVLHMAAALGVDNILENPIDSISTNFYGSEIVLNAALKYKKRILIASTSEIYGKNTKSELCETDDRIVGTPQKLRWTYSDAKALEEATAYYLFLTKQLKVTTIRFFNTVGPRQTGKYGMVIPRFVKAAIANEPLQIFGDGTQTRVFCHVMDSVRAVLALANEDKTIGEVFNIGGKGEISILDLAKLVIKLTNSKSEITYTDYQDAYAAGYEDMARRVPDLSKIKNFVGWESKLDLRKIIEDVHASYVKKT
jgi:UDP-glucose 4-epimerase